MRTHSRTRYRLEVGLAVVSVVLALVTLVWKDWIEIVFGIDPDEGSGVLEYLITIAFIAAAIVLALLARNERRHLAAG